MVKGAARGTSSGRASAAATSTEKVSLSAPKPNDSTGDGGDGDGDGETARRRVEEEEEEPGWRAAATRPGRGLAPGLAAGFPESRIRGEDAEEIEGSMATSGEAETGSRAGGIPGEAAQ
jgi:hypothetical protein